MVFSICFAVLVISGVLGTTKPFNNQDSCYLIINDDNGINYRGNWDSTQNGTCVDWRGLDPTYSYFHPKFEAMKRKGIKSNFCRNPDKAASPWCYTYIDNGNRKYLWSYCSVAECDFELVKEKVECDGTGKPSSLKKGFKETHEECAAACLLESVYFIYGREDGQYKRQCYCEIEANDGNCKEMANSNHNVYKLRDFALEKKGVECDGTGKASSEYKGVKDTLTKCAAACKGISHYFIYGVNGGASEKKCYCEIEANSATCKHYANINHNLYKFRATMAAGLSG